MVHAPTVALSLIPRPSSYPPASGLDIFLLFYRVIVQCVADMHALLDTLAADPRADLSRVGVAGPSMGGYASTLAFVDVPAVQAAVPMIGVPSFARRWRDLLDECAFSNPEWADALLAAQASTAAQTAWIESIDPMPRLAGAAPRALFFMNNDFDSDQPKHYTIETYRLLRSAWAAAPEQLRLGIYPAAHSVTPTMEADAVAWFAAHLLHAQPTLDEQPSS